MSRYRFALLAVLIASTTFASSCTEDPLYPARSIIVTGADMPSLGAEAVFELWLSFPPEGVSPKNRTIDHDEPQYFSAGRFTVDASGALRAPGGGPPSFAIPSGYNPSLVFEALVSVEPREDDDTIPDAPMLWGRFFGDDKRGHALLETATPRTFDTTALLERKGSFVLEAPTSSSPDDSLSGIWFLEHRPNTTTGEPLSPGIGMPAMPLHHDNDNWVYEAWLVERRDGATGYTSLGRFRSPASIDDNGAGPSAGPNVSAAHRFPGEDFVVPQRRLADTSYGVVVSLQPEAIRLSAPLIRLLERATIGVDAASGVTLNMTPTSRLPLIEVTIDR